VQLRLAAVGGWKIQVEKQEGHQPPTKRCTYMQSFNYRSIVLPEISFDKQSLIYDIPPSQPLAQSAQFDTTEPQLH